MIRLLRGQVVIREHLYAGYDQYPSIIIPDVSTRHDKDAIARERTWHRGEVLAAGPPALHGPHEVPQEFKVGDLVIFHFEHLEKSWTRPWSDGKDATWVPQSCVDAVLE